MSVAKVVELTSSSKNSSDDAVRKLIKRASKTIDNIQGVWVKDVKADVRKGRIVRWRVLCKVTFLLN